MKRPENGWPPSRTVELVCLIPVAASGLYTVFSGYQNSDGNAALAGILTSVGALMIGLLIFNNGMREAQDFHDQEEMRRDIQTIKRRIAEISEKVDGPSSVRI